MTTSEIEAIAPDGDVILVVGTTDPAKFRVYSQCLQAASKVFATMFGPNWREGRALSRTEPKEVALPDDDMAAMRTILGFLHFQNSEAGITEAANPPNALLNVVLHADKYDVFAVLEVFVQSQLLQCKASTTEDRLHCFAVLLRLTKVDFECPFLFDLVAKHAGSYFPYLNHPSLQQAFDLRQLMGIEEVRTRLRLEIISLCKHTPCGYGCQFESSARNHICPYATPDRIAACEPLRIIWKLKSSFLRRGVFEESDINSIDYVLGQCPDYTKCKCPKEIFEKLDQVFMKVIRSLKELRDNSAEDLNGGENQSFY